MPEIGEVARVVHYIRKNLAGKTLAKVVAERDENVFGKVGTSAEEIMKSLTGKSVLDARQQGKYFWMIMSSPPHPLMHFGMAGWFKFRNEETFYYKPSKDESPEWPPKYWKFRIETKEEPKCEAAFVDFRRFARIRLIDCPAEKIRNLSPLVENGPDPVIDKGILTEEWLADKLGSKRIPVKALLLDQANISGIGNWVGDEILYNARIHPEQYSNTLTPSQIAQLHKSIHSICGFAVEHLSDSSKFPKEWLFKHRWSKGKKDSSTTLPNGLKFVYLKVGGRTSCVVPSVQKKTGPVAKDVEGEVGEDEEVDGEEIPAPKRGKKASKANKEDIDEPALTAPKIATKGKKRTAKQEDEQPEGPGKDEDQSEEEQKPASKKQKSNTKATANGKDAIPKPKKRSGRTQKEEPGEDDPVKDEDDSEEEKEPATKERRSNTKATTNGTDVAPKPKKQSANSKTNVTSKPDEDGRGRRISTRTSGKGV